MLAFTPTQIHPFHSAPGGSASLVSETRTVSPGQELELGVLLKPNPGWHTYWINAGDAGGPTKVKLNLPKGWIESEPQFPTPSRLEFSGSISYGYDSPTLIIIPVKVPRLLSSKTYSISGRVKWLTCNAETCKPADADLRLSLGVGKPSKSNSYSLFSRTLSQLPGSGTGLNVMAKSVSEGVRLEVEGAHITNHSDAYFFAQEPGVVDYSKKQNTVTDGNTFMITLPKSPYSQRKVTKLVGVLKVVSQLSPLKESSFKIDVPVTP